MRTKGWLYIVVLLFLAGCRPQVAATTEVLVMPPTAPASSPTPETGTAARATQTPEARPSPTATATETPAGASPSPTSTNPPATKAATEPPTATATGLPAATASPTRAPVTETPAPPQIVSFDVSPKRISQGDPLTVSWQTEGATTVTVCAIPDLQAAQRACFEAPPSGTEVLETAPQATIYEMTLTVSNEAFEGVAQEYVCVDVSDLFFQDPHGRCGAAPPVASYAAAQPFEGGLMIWVEQSDAFLVFLDDHTFWRFTAPLAFKPGASEENRVGGAPQGLFEPVSGFGLLWRGEVDGAEDLRAQLGWALAPEFGFQTVTQRGIETTWHFLDRYLRAPDGRVIYYFRQVYLGPRWDYVQ